MGEWAARPDALDLQILRTLFWLTGLATVLIALIVAPISPSWALRYGLIGGLALVNWIGLATILVGATTARPGLCLIGFAPKPLLLVVLLAAGKYGMIEITSFLAGLNTFFVTLFGFLAWRGFQNKRRSSRP